MKHIKTYRLFENLNIDTEEIELLFVNLTDDDFQVHVSKIYDGFKVEIDKQLHFRTSDIVDEVLFAIDLTKKKYDLSLTKIYYKPPFNKGHKTFSTDIEEVFSKNDVIKYLELYFTKEKVVKEPKKGIIGTFLDKFKSKEITVEEKIIDDNYQSCKRYIDNLSDGNYRFFVSNKETLDEIIKQYDWIFQTGLGPSLILKDLKESDGGFIVTLKKLPDPSNSRSNLRW